MARLLRGALVALIAALVGLGGALPSTAAVSPPPDQATAVDCDNPPAGYAVPARCEVDVQVLQPVCESGIPKLHYRVAATGSTSPTVTVTWVNPTGADVVQADLPLEGTLTWPGAAVGGDGLGSDWPGWTELASGDWVEGDAFDWARPAVDVVFHVDSDAVVSASYPTASAACVAGPPDDEVLSADVLSDGPAGRGGGGVISEVLSDTGSEAGPLLVAGTAFVVLGGLAVAGVTVARRRRAAL
ncbi:peptidase [Cellulomonas fengjieae]|uniref:peptidase n=1 Tax=Cellulomonas fengjieae TaxID=2819978 RepID=UPI001AAF173D|nr:peptidase [Cellulomonas fengjieae]MBO3100642.1 peptidase [Cellulomonas fengjieae]